jgi:hypothetical protein
VSFAPNISRTMKAGLMIGCDGGNIYMLFIISSGKVASVNSVYLGVLKKTSVGCEKHYNMHVT